MGVYHLTTRGVDRCAIYADLETRVSFQRVLTKMTKRYPIKIYSACQMDNHYHLVAETFENDALAPAMQYLNGVYARIYNETVGRTGHLVERPYRSIPVVRESHMLEVCRYVDLNPVRAGMCERPEDYRWNSIRAILGFVSPPPYLDTSWTLRLFHEDPERARVEYALFVADGIGRPRPAALSI
jgi:REP element-mobilizing transposase RayT